MGAAEQTQHKHIVKQQPEKGAKKFLKWPLQAGSVVKPLQQKYCKHVYCLVQKRFWSLDLISLFLTTVQLILYITHSLRRTELWTSKGINTHSRGEHSLFVF